MVNTAKLKKAIRFMVDRSIPLLSKVLAVLIICFASFRLFTAFDAENVLPKDIIGAVLMYVCSALILVDLSFNLTRAVGLYAFAIGSNRLILSLSYVFEEGTVMLIFGLVLAGMSLNLCYTGFCFVKGTTRKRQSMVFTTVGIFLVYIALILVECELFTSTVQDVIRKSPDMIPQMGMYLVLFGCLGTNEVRSNDREEQMNRILERMRQTRGYLDESYIGQRAASILSAAFTDRSSWKDMNGHGPVESEYICYLIHGRKDYSIIRAQKWKGSDAIYITLSDHRYGSMIDAFRFKATGIVPIGDEGDYRSIIILGEGTDEIRFNVKRRAAECPSKE